MKLHILALCVGLSACNGQQAAPEKAEPAATATVATATAKAGAPAGVTMGSVGELSAPDEITPSLRGGRPADPKLWPASLYSHSAGGSCTSTLVGQRVLLTAAHCVANGGTVTFALAGQTYSAQCEHAAEYATNATADYALCAVDKPIPGVAFERVNGDPALVKVNATLLLTGYGCTKDDGTGGNDNIYRIGDAKVVALPTGTSNDIQTKGQVALCFGDSGGPAFVVSGSKRTLVSVNSRVGVKPGGTLNDMSYLSSTSTPMALAFLNGWAQRKSLQICGLPGSTAANCR